MDVKQHSYLEERSLTPPTARFSVVKRYDLGLCGGEAVLQHPVARERQHHRQVSLHGDIGISV